MFGFQLADFRTYRSLDYLPPKPHDRKAKTKLYAHKHICTHHLQGQFRRVEPGGTLHTAVFSRATVWFREVMT